MPATDLDKATRELFVKGEPLDQAYMRTPIIEEIKRRNQITYSGGKYIERLIDMDTIEDQVQVYETNDALTDEKQETLEKPRFYWRKAQLPLRYNVDEELQNVHGDGTVQLVNLAKHLLSKGMRDLKKWWEKAMFNDGSATGILDGNLKKWQSLVSALDHDTTYGGIARKFSTNTNDEWQGADVGGLNESISSGSQGTATTLSKGRLQKWINETSVADCMESPEDLMIVMCPTLWDKLSTEMEAHSMYKAGKKQDQGITSMYFNNHEVVSVPYLQRTSETRAWVFILNLKYWEFRIHSQRKEELKPWVWQGDRSGGHDYWLARIMWAGNWVNWKPKSSLWLSNVS